MMMSRSSCSAAPRHDDEVSRCIICLDSDPLPVQLGCACRSDAGLAHVNCIIETAIAQQAHRGREVWWTCQTCRQNFTGGMQVGLAKAWWSLACDQAEESEERLCAASNLAAAHRSQGQHSAAERINRQNA